jgi:hypothetical protein
LSEGFCVILADSVIKSTPFVWVAPGGLLTRISHS